MNFQDEFPSASAGIGAPGVKGPGTKVESLRPDALVVTSISGPNGALRSLALGATQVGAKFYLIGDRKSPLGFGLENCDYYPLERQAEIPGSLARLLPEGCYSRKNLGYILAAMEGSRLIAETDDDNYPLGGFWMERTPVGPARMATGTKWFNPYGSFGRPDVWPRGYPLEFLRQAGESSTMEMRSNSPIQQGLAAENPDVDAVFRLTRELPVDFADGKPLSIGQGTWSPFNSQATFWFREALILAYLPTFCSFRMTDIWRGFVAQRIAWTCSWSLRFESPVVRQERNEHDLLKDFENEIPGYLNNRRICQTLEDLDLRSGVDAMPDNLRICYRALVDGGWIGNGELELLDAWLSDFEAFADSRGHTQREMA